MQRLYEFSVLSRAYYIVVVPLKKQRTGKFLRPWDSPDEMNLEEVCSGGEKPILFSFIFHLF